MRLGWIINYVYSFCRSLPEKREFHREKDTSSSDSEEAGAKMHKLGEADPEESGLRK